MAGAKYHQPPNLPSGRLYFEFSFVDRPINFPPKQKFLDETLYETLYMRTPIP